MKDIVAALISMSLLLCAGCAEPEPRPKAPDLSALVAAYAAPSGAVNRESAQRLVEEAATELALVGDAEGIIGLIELMFSDLGSLGSGEEGLAVRRDPLTVGGVDVDAGGWVVYHRICPATNSAGVRGTLRATALLDVDAFEPVIWGRFDDCRADQAALDADVALHIDWVDGEPQSVLVRITGRTEVGEALKQGEFSLRWQGSELMTRATLPGLGDFLVGYDATTGRSLIEGGNGRFVCTATGCEGPDGGFAW